MPNLFTTSHISETTETGTPRDHKQTQGRQENHFVGQRGHSGDGEPFQSALNLAHAQRFDSGSTSRPESQYSSLFSSVVITVRQSGDGYFNFLHV